MITSLCKLETTKENVFYVQQNKYKDLGKNELTPIPRDNAHAFLSYLRFSEFLEFQIELMYKFKHIPFS
jgi:hypothetical protein